MKNLDDIIKNLKQELRKGTLVLATLSELRDKHYGYSLVETMNQKGLLIDQNTLYPLLRRLDKQGLLESTWEVVDPRPRKYYQLNYNGKHVLKALTQTFYESNKIISDILKEEK